MGNSRILYFLSKAILLFAIGALLYSLYLKGGGKEAGNWDSMGYLAFLLGLGLEYFLKKKKRENRGH